MIQGTWGKKGVFRLTVPEYHGLYQWLLHIQLYFHVTKRTVKHGLVDSALYRKPSGSSCAPQLFKTHLKCGTRRAASRWSGLFLEMQVLSHHPGLLTWKPGVRPHTTIHILTRPFHESDAQLKLRTAGFIPTWLYPPSLPTVFLVSIKEKKITLPLSSSCHLYRSQSRIFCVSCIWDIRNPEAFLASRH